MPPKNKRAAPKEEPASKKSKTEEKKKEEPKKEEPKKEEPKKEDKPAEEQPAEEAGEKEQDDKKDARPSIKDKIVFDNAETTLNVVPTTGGKVLMALTDGGMQFLIAGARANVGLKAGRYFYEVKVIEALTPMEGAHQGKARLPLPRQLVRLGVSTAGSSLILGDTEDCVCFDSDGFFFAEKKKSAVSQRFSRDMVIGVLLNLDAKSPNANTISLFRNGERVSKPQPLPEKLKGQPLFPHVSFRNVSVQVNFGATPLASLPFKCRMLQDAASADVKEVKPTVPKDGKYDVLFPVAFPDEGTFDWLDGFLEKNPQYVEISDRKIQDWAIKSGAWKPKSQNWKTSNDKPEFNFGIQHLDDFSVRRAINSIAPIVPRHYIVMEVKQNLTAADRAAQLKKFSAPHFKKVAHVVMGEPKADFKKKVQAQLLAEKQQKAEASWKVRKLDKERKKALALKQKQIAEAQKAAKEAKEAAAKEAAAKKAAEETKEGEKKEEGDKKEEEKKEEDKPEEKKEEEKKEEEKKEEEEEEDEPMPTAELTEEEKKLNFRPPLVTDLTAQALNASFAHFTIPEKSEGFDAVNFEWQNESKSKEYLKKWVLDKKLTSRIEDIQPSEWFTTFATGYQKSYQEWQTKQKEFQTTKKKEEAKEGKKEADADKKEEDEDDEDDKKMEVDIFSIEDVCDMGNGEPLFAKFAFEDWALMTLRYELHVLQAAFKKDANDPDRVGIPENHLAFYYTRYFKKQFNPKCFGKETVEQVVDLVKDTVKIDEDSKMLTSVVAEEPEGAAAYVKMQEESRRKRQQRIDAGDETARLDFSFLQQQQQREQRPAKGGAKGDAAAAGAVAAVPGSAPRMVPAPRSQGWQNQQARAPAWQGGKSGGKSGGKWQPQQQQPQQQQYAPRLGKVGKK